MIKIELTVDELSLLLKALAAARVDMDRSTIDLTKPLAMKLVERFRIATTDLARDLIAEFD